jgi:hypothetical protein
MTQRAPDDQFGADAAVFVMAVPELIPIAHEPGYRTSTIGRYAGGQFFASIHGAQPPGADQMDRSTIRWYVILHLFDEAGRHQSSDIWCAGVGPYCTGEIAEAAEARMQRLLDGLPDRNYGDIAIRTFLVRQDGIVFGLMDESDPERGDWAELYPDELGFAAPWDGLYST